METRARTTSDHIRDDQKLEEALKPGPVAVATGGKAEVGDQNWSLKPVVTSELSKMERQLGGFLLPM